MGADWLAEKGRQGFTDRGDARPPRRESGWDMLGGSSYVASTAAMERGPPGGETAVASTMDGKHPTETPA